MMQSNIRLLYVSSDAIVNYCTTHPINWADKEQANGPGNVLTPTPAVGLFYDLLAQRETLFSQDEYWQYAQEAWIDFLRGQPDHVKVGLKARMFRNFYPSCIDTIHAWALMAETGRFSYCILDSVRDAVSKKDITVYAQDGKSIGVALWVNSKYANEWTKYKRSHRGQVIDVVDVCLPMERPPRPGNKRWYCLDDFAPVFANLVMGYTPTATPMPKYGQSSMSYGKPAYNEPEF